MSNSLALIIGAMKCGTTSMFEYLSQHPEILPCAQKEPKFFSHQENWVRGWQWYSSLWDGLEDRNCIALEASPSYTNRALESANRMASTRADFRFIYILRNPLERVESALRHTYYLSNSKENKINYNQNFTDNRFEQFLSQAIDSSKYATKVREYYKRFPRHHILILQLEDLKYHPQQVMKRVCHFLGIDADFQFSNLTTIYNAKNSYRQDTLWKRMANIAHLKSAANYFPQQYKARLRDILSQPSTSSKDVPPPLTEQVKESIRHELREDLKELSFDYGVDVSKWGIVANHI